MPNTITFSNVDEELLNEQRLELLNLIWDKPNGYILWGLVAMLDDWYDRANPVEEA
jgi:hypothetical protein